MSAPGDAPHFGGREPPPPSCDGNDPASELVMYEKNVKLWEFETEVDPKKRGVRLLRNLSGIARSVADTLEFDEIACTKGTENLLKALKDHFAPHLEVSLPRAFERAIYGSPRTSKESIQEYIIRCERAFHMLQKEGVTLPDTAIGYVIYRQAALTENQELRFGAWSRGKYDQKTVVSCLRKLDKVVMESKGKSSTAFLQEDGEGDSGEEFFPTSQEGYEDSDAENVIYMEEDDPNRIYDEAEAQLALATYQEVRKSLNAKQKARQYYGSGKRGPSGKASFTRQRKKITVEELKLRTRCGRCGLIGHWAAECGNPPDARGKQFAAAQSHKSQGSSSVSSGGKPGSQSTGQQSWYVSAGSACPLELLQCGFCFSCGDKHEIGNIENPQCKSVFVSSSQESSAETHVSCSFSGDRVDVFELPACLESETASYAQFTGLTTSPTMAVVDTAAQDGLIGAAALERLKERLAQCGLTVVWTGRQAKAHGVGGQATVLGIVAIPLGVAGKTGILEATVVTGEVPLLLPVKMLRSLRAVVDLNEMSVRFHALQRSVELSTLPSGHVAIEVTDFGTEGFVFPHEAAKAAEYQESDFRINLGPNQSGSVMLSHLPVFNASFPHGGRSSCQLSSAPAAVFRSGLCERSHWGKATQFETSFEALASGARQGSHGGAAGWIGSIGALVASSEWSPERLWPAFARAARRARQACRGFDKHAREDRACEDGRGVSSPGQQAESRRQPAWRLGDMHGLPVKMEPVQEHKHGSSQEESSSSTELSKLSTGEVRCGQDGVCHQGQARARVPHRVCEVGELYEGGDENGASTAAQLDAECQQQPLASNQRVGDDSATRGDEAGGDQGDGEGRNAPDAGQTAHSAQAAGHCGADEDGVCIHGPGDEVPGKSGVPRLGDVRVCREAVGEPGGSPSHGEGDEGDRSGQGFEDKGTWVRLKGSDGELKGRVDKLNQGGHFWAQKICLEEGEEMYEVEMEDLEDETECLVKIGQTARSKMEDVVEEVEEKALPKKTKKQLRKAQAEVWPVDVSEVFSPPRLTKEAPKLGLKPGGAYDLKTGYNLRCHKDRKRMEEELAFDKPELLLCCPPCGPFSVLQQLNYPKMPADKVKHIIAEGVDCLKIAAKQCKQQHEAGRVFIFEHPRNSKAWREEELEELRRLPGVYVCHFDMCRYGMRVKKDLNKKPTTMIVNSESIAQELQRRCDGSHSHEHLMGGLAAAAAAEYPVRLCRAILKGLRKHLAQREPKPEDEATILAMGLEDELDEEVERAGESRREQGEEGEEEDEEEAPAAEETHTQSSRSSNSSRRQQCPERTR